MKRVLFVSVSSLLLLVFFIVNHYTIYSIGRSENEIEKFLLETWYKENNFDENLQPLVLEIFPIEKSNKVVATFLYSNDKIGALILKKGLNQKLMLEEILYGKAIYSEIIDTSKGRYALFFGENKQLAIQTIHSDVTKNTGLDIAVPPQRYFSHYEKVEKQSNMEAVPVIYYKTLRGAIDAAASEFHDMEIIFVDNENVTFLLHSYEENTLITALGGYVFEEEGYLLTTIGDPISYSMEGDKIFCYEEKNINNADKKLTYLHGLVPGAEDVKKVVLEVELKGRLVYQNVSDVVHNQFFIYIQSPEYLKGSENLVKKFHLYDKDGRYLGTEMKS